MIDTGDKERLRAKFGISASLPDERDAMTAMTLHNDQGRRTG